MMVPWYVKIPAKIVLSRLPVRYETWRSLDLFRAGSMDNPETAFTVFMMHCAAAGFAGRRDYTVLELGPGDSMLTALYARAMGARHTILVDQTPLASSQLRLFDAAEKLLASRGLAGSGVSGVRSLEEARRRLHCDYLTDGLASLRSLPDAGVDLIFSNAVIEHVRKRDFAATARELYRIMAPDGVASHWIDYRDHLQTALNNLRFSESVWESEFIVRSGFYTNRLAEAEIRELFEQAGFLVEVRDVQYWPDGLPTSQAVMSEPFASMSPDRLMVMTNWLILRKPGAVS